MGKPSNEWETLQHPELDGQSIFLEGNRTGVLLFHGYTASPIEVEQLAQFLHRSQYTISAPLLPGHGTTPKDLNQKTWRDWTKAAVKGLDELSARCDTIVVGGESAGALLALYLAERHSEKIKGILCYSPAIKVKNIAYSGLASLFTPYKIKKNMKDDLLPWQGYKVFPMKANFQLFLLQCEVKYQLSKISQPIVIFQGKFDHTIEPESSLEVYESISSNQKTIIMMEESGHCVLLDKEFEKVNSMSLNFIQQATYIP